MPPSRDRDKSIFGFLAIFLSVFLAYIFPQISPDLCARTISSFNIVILFGWFAFGHWGGIPLSILASIAALWSFLRIGRYECLIFTLTFLFPNILGFGFFSVRSRIDRACALKSEKLEELSNVLSNDVAEKKNHITSLKQKSDRYSILKNLTESLSTVLALDDIKGLIIEKTLMTLGKTKVRALLYLVDIEKQELELASSRGSSKVMAKKGDIFDHWVLRHRKSLIVEDVTRDFRFPADAIEEVKAVFRSLIAVPLMSEGKATGLLRMDSLNEFMFTQDDLRLLDIISDLGAVAIQNALLYSRTQDLAIRDGLTGLVVRRYFMERFQEEMKRASRNRVALSLLLLDIDHFKSFNDRYGHTAGDLVLKHLSHTIKSVMREVDIVARYGGEEIALLLIGIDKEKAKSTAETIRKRIQDKPFMLRMQKMCVTVSIGISGYPDDAASEEELMRIADERLYKAKLNGRDRVCLA